MMEKWRPFRQQCDKRAFAQECLKKKASNGLVLVCICIWAALGVGVDLFLFDG